MLFFDREKDENDNRARKVADRYGVKGEYNVSYRNRAIGHQEELSTFDTVRIILLLPWMRRARY